MFFRNVVALMLLLASGCSIANIGIPFFNSALVLGNNHYPYMELKNGVSDAALIAQELRQNGFEVTTVYETDRAALLNSLKQFVVSTRSNIGVSETAVVYLSGAGYHCNGEDFFIPNISGAKPANKKSQPVQQMLEQAVPLQQIREQLDGMARKLILIFDAGRVATDAKCKRPFATPQLKSHWLNVYSSAPGEVALDGDVNSPFAAALAKWLKRTDLTALDVFQNVADDVWQNTQYKQRVQIDSLIPYRIHLCQRGSCQPAPAPQEMPAANSEAQPAIESKER